MGRSGILAAGNFIVDHVKMIDAWPTQDALVSIQSEQSSNGGGPFNVLIDLARLFPDASQRAFPLEATGLVGDDSNGAWIIDTCREHGVAIDQLRTTDAAPTSYTDVMTVAGDGRRTFFHQRGANAHFSRSDLDLGQSNARIFYLGYLLLLDTLDAIDAEGSTEATSILRDAKAAGMRRVVDLVSEDSDRFRAVIAPALPEVDVLLTNEFEASRLAGIDLSDGHYNRDTAKRAAEAILAMGVNEWVVIHAPSGAVALSTDGTFEAAGSLALPNEEIAGAVGAGDAFAAGIVYGLHEELPMADSLRLASSVAASCLRHPTTSEGILPLAECAELEKRHGLRDF